MAKKASPRGRRRKPTPQRQRGWGRRLRRLLLWGLLLFIPCAGLYTWYLDWRVTSQFEGKRWALPARVYARPLELYEGLRLPAEALEQELQAAGYQSGQGPGSYGRDGGYFRISTRGFMFPDGSEPARTVRLSIADQRLRTLQGVERPVDLVRLEPALIGSIYPAHREDRVLVRLDEVPPALVQALLATEDRDFYQHYGLSPTGIARALIANLRAGRVVQGGSTITQQLVKNFYLTSERSLWRKANEAVMALLLEYHYDKAEILEAYLNEVYLGQQGRRSIHGFGLASQFYFGRPLSELSLAQQALLVGLVKGPSYYNPRQHPQRAQERRDLVLALMAEQGFVSAAEARAAAARPLGLARRAEGTEANYPAFMDLVKRHLQRDYRAKDLSSEGLRIFTTLAPHVQRAAEQAVRQRMQAWDRPELEAAAVVLDVDSGEVSALVGGRDPRYAGFNRALDARRPIGSLIKPAVYLAALEQSSRYGLGTPILDQPVQLTDERGEVWAPQNYDRSFRGAMPLWQALAESRNAATVRLGLDVGLRAVVDVLERLGGEVPARVYPSLLLGSTAQTPLEVAGMYQTLASGGFRTPLRAVRAVMTRTGELLSRYPLAVERAFDPQTVYQLNYALQTVVGEGTARGLQRWLPAELAAAGKTGTTNDTRDSWFAGFTGDLLGVVWLGMDDNGRTGLTGSSGALTVWGELFSQLAPQPLRLPQPDGVEWAWIDSTTGALAAEYCDGARQLPYRSGALPTEQAACVRERGGLDRTVDWFKDMLR